VKEKPSLKLSIQKTKIITSGPITSWQIDGEKMETMTNFIFLGSKITTDGDCNHKINVGRRLNVLYLFRLLEEGRTERLI